MLTKLMLLTALITNLLACRPFFFGGKYKFGETKHLQEVEEALREDRFNDAIAAYQAHIEDRLAEDDRPAWENPYFYYLLIGDIELRRGEVDKALKAYELAESNGVADELVADRYRSVGRWYEEKQELQSAIEVLSRYKDRDPLLIEAILDRLAKELTRLEDSKEKPAAGL